MSVDHSPIFNTNAVTVPGFGGDRKTVNQVMDRKDKGFKIDCLGAAG
jgi:hypothetical protein